MSQDAYYARVDRITAEVLESLSQLAPGLSDLLFTGYQAIQEAADRDLPGEQRTGLTNLSFFYLLATCIDFLFFLHQRHRGVSIYEHELQHVFGVLLGHAERQQEELAKAEGHAHEIEEPRLPLLGPAAFEQEIARLRQRLRETRG
ncbi:MAG: hypothetical protein ACRELA_04200 [Candidatus Rokuibacteriota bacterium]